MSDSMETTSRPYFVSIDLVLVGLLGAWLILTASARLDALPVRAIIGLIAILFAPGYAIVSALFPRKNTHTEPFTEIRAEVVGVDGRVTIVERLLLSVALSVCLVPLLGLGLGLLQMEIQTSTTMEIVGSATVGLAIVALIRRRQVQSDDRFDPKVIAFIRSCFSQLRGVDSPVVFILLIGFVIAGAGIGAAVLGAERGEDFTEFSVVAEDPETGEFVADQYPQNLTESASDRIHVEITNNEGEPMEYSVVVLLQSFGEAGQIQEIETVSTFSTTLQPGESAREQLSADPDLTGDNLRLTYLLYVDSPPTDEPPSTDNAYRHLHLWVDVPA
jgi:uncharacterized membrane protein